MTLSREPAPSSFRDPAGFVFFEDGEPYRAVSTGYLPHLRLLESSGLAEELQGEGLLIGHEEVPAESGPFDGIAAVLRPEKIGLIAYPYEWPFSALKDAALATLDIQIRALQFGMTLKDASAFNIQFHHGRPVLIDTLSFEPYEEGKPWAGYSQFCRHFLAPLALMAYGHRECGRLSQLWIEGVPLDVASALLPRATRWKPGIQIHLHMHARSSRREAIGTEPPRVSRNGLLGLLDSLRKTVGNLELADHRTTWSHYYEDTNYTAEAMAAKRQIVAEMVAQCKPATVWDLGANTGEFSRIAADAGAQVAAWDMDAGAVDRHYRQIRLEGERRVLPLILDLSAPSPALGWNLQERESWISRGPCDLGMALALVHHLAFGNNVPLRKVAELFAQVSPRWIVEFVPKSDSQVQRMLASRTDIFSGYSQAGFEQAFGTAFQIERRAAIPGSERILYSLCRCAA